MAEQTFSIGRALTWASFLACSWTWCIGMFLPVLLVRDYGAWGFVVFAVPNVVGAAAFGWVLAAPGASEQIVTLHGRAMAAFSLVTCAFHGFFLGWLASGLADRIGVSGAGWTALVGVPVTVPLLVLAFISRLPSPLWWARVSLGVLVASLVMLAGCILVWGGIWSGGAGIGGTGAAGAAWLAPVTVLGFMLCPYLDATFHRARQSLGASEAKAAFTLGFGVLFLCMILFTLAYAGVFLAGAAGVTFVTVHIVIQALFTCGVHARELHHSARRTMRTPVPLAIVPTAAGMLIGVLSGASIFDLAAHPMVRGEIAYRSFMAFYGLVFPAYVWLCMIPTRDGHAGGSGAAGRWKMRVFWLAVGIAAPMYWMGFIEQQVLWLGPGVMVILLARLLVRRH